MLFITLRTTANSFTKMKISLPWMYVRKTNRSQNEGECCCCCCCRRGKQSEKETILQELNAAIASSSALAASVGRCQFSFTTQFAFASNPATENAMRRQNRLRKIDRRTDGVKCTWLRSVLKEDGISFILSFFLPRHAETTCAML